MLDFIELHTDLIEHAWPSGFEQSMGKYLVELVRPWVDEVWIDRMGNVICHKKGPGRKMMFPAHMDVLGLLVLNIDENGFARFDTNGGFSTENLLSAAFVSENGVRACVRARGRSKSTGKPIGELRDRKDLYLDLGTDNREDTLALLDVGSVFKYASKPIRLLNNKLSTPYADDLACCAMMIIAMELLKDTIPENDCYFVFTVQEEIGLRGAGAAAYVIEPDVCIVLDGTHASDCLSDNIMIGNNLGDGPCIKIRDSSMICDLPVIEYLRSVAQNQNIICQDEIMVRGGTDGKVVQKSKTGVMTGGISLAIRHIHSYMETIDLRDVHECIRLITAAAMAGYE